VEERAADGRALVFVQFDSFPRLGDEAQAVGGKVLHLPPILSRRIMTEVSEMATVTITEVLDDLRAADEITRRFERRYWLSSADFYELYSQGLLDDGEHTEDFAMWAAYYEIKQDRERDLQRLSEERVRRFREQARLGVVEIAPPEPAIEIVP